MWKITYQQMYFPHRCNIYKKCYQSKIVREITYVTGYKNYFRGATAPVEVTGAFPLPPELIIPTAKLIARKDILVNSFKRDWKQGLKTLENYIEIRNIRILPV